MFFEWLQLATGEETVLCARLAHPWVPFRWVPHSSGAALNASPPRQVGIRGQTPWNKIQWYHGTKRQKLITLFYSKQTDKAITSYGRIRILTLWVVRSLVSSKRREKVAEVMCRFFWNKKKLETTRHTSTIHSEVKCGVLTAVTAHHYPRLSWSLKFAWTGVHSICFSRCWPAFINSTC